MNRHSQLFAKGIRLPLVDPTGFGWVQDAQAAEQAIRSVLLTEPGERVGRPTYGVGLRQRFLFSPSSLATRSLIRRAVIDAIERDEPRVELEDVEVTADPQGSSVLHIEIRYRLPAPAGVSSIPVDFDLNVGVI